MLLLPLSLLASLDGDYEQGKRLAILSQERNTNPLGDFLGYWSGTVAVVGLGQTEQAWQQSLSALELAIRWDWWGMMTWILPVMAIILARQGQQDRAVEILGLYDGHPARPPGFAENWPLVNECRVQL